MQKTTNYQLNKIELTDSPADITVINANWDTIDTNLKKLSDEKFDKSGGTITGKTTISAGGLDVTGGTKTDTLETTGNVSIGGILTAVKDLIAKAALTVTGKLTANGGLTVTGGTSTDTLTAKNGLEVTGNAIFNSPIIGKSSLLSVVDVTKGTAPATQKSWHLGFYDKNGFGIPANRLARLQYTLSTDNTAQIALYVNRPNEGSTEDPVGIITQWLSGENPRISVTHHPSNDSNDKQVATTYWVRNLKATTSQYGLIKLADETALLSEADDATLTVDAAYELNDFRRMNTAYNVGDKVSCAFRYEFFLECTKAGTTSAQSLDTRNVTFGQVIMDGTCQWTVRAHVRSVNNKVADANGNVTLSIPTPTIASQAEAEAGTNNTKFMTPLRTKQAIDKLAPVKKVNNVEPDSNGNVTIPTTDENTIKSVVLNTFFPVGSIYMDATGNIDPNTQFGGTWVKIKNAFLYGSGTKGIGTTGGEENHTLTTNEMPSHDHRMGSVRATGSFGANKNYSGSYETGAFSRGQDLVGRDGYEDGTAAKYNFSFYNGSSGSVSANGGGQAHNNMPPYLVVNIWKRTA